MDPVWLLIALLFGLGARQLKLPPLVGFLLAGFFLNALGEQGGELLEIASHIGVLLLLFTIGLKLSLSSFLSPAVWGGATAHMLLTCLLSVGVVGVLIVAQMVASDWNVAVLIAFAFSFSSTVLAVKIFEARGEMRARHALVAIGILIIQDLVAVIFLLAADGAPPSVWAFALLALPLARPVLLRLLVHVGHGEMLVLFGLTAAIAGAELFDLVGMKDDLGALAFGVLLSHHEKSMELTRSLLAFKDFFLIGFFLSIGLIGFPVLGDLALALLLVAILLPVKMGLYFVLLTRFRLRARTAFLSMLGLATFSEFGLIVANEGMIVGWLPEKWLVIMAIAVAVSFVIASALNSSAHELYERLEGFLCRFETAQRLPDDLPADVGDAEVLVVGLGRVGRGAYRAMVETYGSRVCGVDVDSRNVARLKKRNYNVILGDAEDMDFWRNVSSDKLCVVMLSIPSHEDKLLAVKWLKMVGYHGRIGAVTKYSEERDELEAAGVDAAFNYYTEVGTGFADHVQRGLAEPG